MFGNLLRWAVLRPILKPLTRILVGLIAIPIFRLVIRRGMRIAKVEEELENDLEQWFRAALILLVATANMEHLLFGWVPLDLEGDQSWIGVFFRLIPDPSTSPSADASSSTSGATAKNGSGNSPASTSTAPARSLP